MLQFVARTREHTTSAIQIWGAKNGVRDEEVRFMTDFVGDIMKDWTVNQYNKIKTKKSVPLLATEKNKRQFEKDDEKEEKETGKKPKL